MMRHVGFSPRAHGESVCDLVLLILQLLSNCSSSVEPGSAQVDVWPEAMVVATASKYPVPTKL